jgi:hypothetical protein
MLGSAGVEAVTWTIELGVGLACLVVGAAALHGARRPFIAILFVIAGIAALGHATVQLTLG